MSNSFGPQSGDKVAFLGDSITESGWAEPTGYVRLVEKALRENGRPIKVIPAGISGHRSNDMLARLQRDVLDHKPNWMTLSCGVNDVWHALQGHGITLEDYKKNITAIVDHAQAAGVKIVILTSTMIMEDASNDLNRALAPYNDFLRSLAREKSLPLADLNDDMQKAVAQRRRDTGRTDDFFTTDGVHMNAAGNALMASGLLKIFGL